MTDISFITDTISIYRKKNRYYKRQYDTIPIISISPILSMIPILSTHLYSKQFTISTVICVKKDDCSLWDQSIPIQLDSILMMSVYGHEFVIAF